jgi:hypothetical protein
MKRFIASAFFLVGSATMLRAQAGPPVSLQAGNAAPDFSATWAAKATLFDSLAVADSLATPRAITAQPFATPALSTPSLAEPAAAASPAPSPRPRFVYGGRDDYRWQLSLSAAWVRFRSSVFNASAVGLKTTVTYFLNDWLGVEGSFTGAFAPAIFSNDIVKIGLYGGGPKIAWRQKRWEPWLHGIFGGAHVNPQTSGGSRNSYSLMAGGGADYRWNPRVSFRLEADYVRTGVFHLTQNNFQLAGGIVFHL